MAFETDSDFNPGKRSFRYPIYPRTEVKESLGALIRHWHKKNGKEASYNINGIEIDQYQYVLVDFKTNEPKYVLFSIQPLEIIPYYQFIAKQIKSCIERKEALQNIAKEHKETLGEYVKEGVLYPWSRCSSFDEFLEIIKTDKKTKEELLRYEPSLKGKL